MQDGGQHHSFLKQGRLRKYVYVLIMYKKNSPFAHKFPVVICMHAFIDFILSCFPSPLSPQKRKIGILLHFILFQVTYWRYHICYI